MKPISRRLAILEQIKKPEISATRVRDGFCPNCDCTEESRTRWRESVGRYWRNIESIEPEIRAMCDRIANQKADCTRNLTMDDVVQAMRSTKGRV